MLIPSRSPMFKTHARRVAKRKTGLSHFSKSAIFSASAGPTNTIHTWKKEPIMGKGNNSQKNDKKDKKPKQDKKGPKIEAAKK